MANYPASLSNASQVLMRNVSLLSGQTPLLVNMPEDGFIDAYLQLNPECKISCFNNNFIDYQALKHKHQNKINTCFSATYHSELKHDLVIIAFPKSKPEFAFTLAMLAPYLTEQTTLLFVGEKKGGVQSSLKLAQHFIENGQKIDAARHCMLFAGTAKAEAIAKTFKLDEWFKQYTLDIDGINLEIASLPGVFSQQKLDVGTKLLLSNLPNQMQGKVLDFGCGAGVISCFIGKKFDRVELSLLDVSALALRSAEKTLEINDLTGQVFASNSLSNVTEKYQHIVSNPPFHQGLKTHYQATEQFLAGIKHYMTKPSDITIVANSFLQYPPIMAQHIGKTNTQAKANGFSIYQVKC